MSDPSSSSTNTGVPSNAGTTTRSTETQGNMSKKPVPKLNPDAKDYVPRATTTTSGSTNNSTSQASGSNNNPRNRRRRNNDGNKSGNSNGQVNKSSEAASSSSNNNNNNNNNGQVNNGNNNRNRRNRGRAPKQANGGGAGGARIDDDDDDIEINIDRPVEQSESQPVAAALASEAGSSSASGSRSAASKDQRRNGRRKDKEVDDSSTPKPRQNRADKGRSRTNGVIQGQPESSSSSSHTTTVVITATVNNNSRGDNNNNRRQRNRKTGDLGGRTFPAAQQSSSNQTGESSGSQKNAQRRLPRVQPKKFVHTVEEDRDLLAALTAGLTNSTYDCMVCWDVIRPAHKVWNCQVCWAAFHLDCLSTWAKKSSEDPNNNGGGWRCPGCQNTQVSIPKEYFCFCGKVNNPDFNRYLTPHSCGELCGRSRECPHPCNVPCHPGPCPPCSGLGPIQSCHCGSESFQLRCVDTDFTFQTGKSCNQVCGELLGCGKHTCSSVCHAGLCPPCEELQEQGCYCGKHERKAKCGEGIPKTMLVDGEERTGYYECHEICHRPLACGKHECTKACHPLDSEPGQCSARPEVVKTCPCGSKTIETLLMGKTRTSCTDPIPVCGGVCKKPLSCGHRCMQKCHNGECLPCKITVTVNCRCGSTRVQKVCSEMGQNGDDLPLCDRLCRGLRTCGKHECTNRCCPAKNKPKGLKVDPAVLEAHTCPLVCGKKLQCGVHNCDMLCHKGHCNPCMNTSFEELSCACGRTVLYPPIPCGTSIPRCKYSCTRPRDCGHTSFSSHPCHPDSEPCPPCIMLVAKQCMCRKAKMPNVPCYKSNPSCGKICGKRLDCNLHNCIKSCHSGECLSPPTEICTQSCPKARKSCGHRCGITCHGDTPCPEDQPCRMTVPSSCKCGHLTMESPCNASAENVWDGKPRIIKCNDYCLIAERNKRVALALEIDENSSQPGPRIPDYDSYVLDYALANMEFTLKIEKQLAEWVADTTKPMLNFPPMKGHRRKFIHELAAHYNVTSESVDVEPYRSVTIRRHLNTSVPDLLASQACRQKRSAGSSTSTTTNTVEQLRKPMIKDPVNAIYLHDLTFGLTRSELAAQLAPVFGNIKYGIRWLTDDDAVLVPHPGSMQMDELEAVLVRLRAGIKAVAAKVDICDRVELCWVNKEGEVVSHTNVGGGSQTKRFFNAAQGNQWAKKMAPPTVANTFALLDDDERIAAAKRAEEERIFKAKEAAGTLSSDAWEEDSGVSSSSAAALAHFSMASGTNPLPNRGVSESSGSEGSDDLTKFVVVEAGEFTNEVVDDWQELLDDDEDQVDAEAVAEAETATEAGVQAEVQAEASSKDVLEGDEESKTKINEADSEEKTEEQTKEEKELSNKGNSDEEAVLVSQSDLSQAGGV
ncbi:FKBP12-associated protein [Haplosporangium sp. Z 27]|nr:FKBP12-associated protein [Haplosporangium sp. Z 27]